MAKTDSPPTTDGENSEEEGLKISTIVLGVVALVLVGVVIYFAISKTKGAPAGADTASKSSSADADKSSSTADATNDPVAGALAGLGQIAAAFAPKTS